MPEQQNTKMIYIAFSIDAEQWPGADNRATYLSLLKCFRDKKLTWLVTQDKHFLFSEEYPDILELADKVGHEIGCHIHFHTINKQKQKALIERGTILLRKRGYQCQSFRGGNHYLNNDIAQALRELNYIIDSSCVPGLAKKIRLADGSNYVNYLRIRTSQPFLIEDLLELPESCFPFSFGNIKNYIFKRFTFPVVLAHPQEYLARIDDFARLHRSSTIIISKGHTWDLLGENRYQLDQEKVHNLKSFFNMIQRRPDIQLVTLAEIRDIIIQQGLYKNNYRPNFNLPAQQFLISICERIQKILFN